MIVHHGSTLDGGREVWWSDKASQIARASNVYIKFERGIYVIDTKTSWYGTLSYETYQRPSLRSARRVAKRWLKGKTIS